MKRYIQILFILSACTSILYGQKQYKDTLCILLDKDFSIEIETQKSLKKYSVVLSKPIVVVHLFIYVLEPQQKILDMKAN